MMSMNMQTTQRVFMLFFLLCVVLPACADDSLCSWVSGGCLELTVTGQGTFDNLEIQLVDQNATSPPNGSSRIGTTFSSGDKIRVPAPAQETTARFSRLNVRARRGSEIVMGSTDISWPDGEHVPAAVRLRGACADGWCRENPPESGEGLPRAKLEAVWASSAQDVWAVNDAGLAFHYDGTNWKTYTDASGSILYGLFGSTPSNVWAVGSNGTAYQFDGQHWHPKPTGRAEALTSVWIAPDSKV